MFSIFKSKRKNKNSNKNVEEFKEDVLDVLDELEENKDFNNNGNILEEHSSAIDSSLLNTSSNRGRKKLPIDELKDKVEFLENELNLAKVNNSANNNIKKEKKLNISSLLAFLSIFVSIFIYFYYDKELKEKSMDIESLNINIEKLVEATDINKEILNLSDENRIVDKIIELENYDKEFYDKYNKNNDELKTMLKEIKESNIDGDKLTKMLSENEKIKELDQKIANTLNSNNEEKDKKINLIMEKYEEANLLVTEVIKKQKEEIISLNNIVNGILQDSKNRINLTKDDIARIAKLETIISNMSNNIPNHSMTPYSQGNNINMGSNTNLNFANSGASWNNNYNQVTTQVYKDLPIFSIYKIMQNKQFYIKNRSNGQLLEQNIAIKDTIIDRFEVLDVDFVNKQVIFKDLISGQTLVLKEGE